MAKLNQIVALAPTKKTRAKEVMEAVYHQFQKPPLFDGISRKYEPKDETGDRLPPENKLPQLRVDDLIAQLKDAMVESLDVIATQDASNCEAKASIVVDGKTIVADVPVTHLMFLEKQLSDIAALVSKIPTPAPEEVWEANGQSDYLHTKPSQAVRTKKIPRNHIKYEATKEHPAQVEMYTEDVIVGTWTTIKYSGTMPSAEKTATMDRVRQLQEAVKIAREQANGIDVKPVKEGDAILDFIFG